MSHVPEMSNVIAEKKTALTFVCYNERFIIVKQLYRNGRGLFLDDSTPMQRAWRLPEWGWKGLAFTSTKSLHWTWLGDFEVTCYTIILSRKSTNFWKGNWVALELQSSWKGFRFLKCFLNHFRGSEKVFVFKKTLFHEKVPEFLENVSEVHRKF